MGHRVAVLRQRAPAAVRRAARLLRHTGEHVRRRLHRVAGDEPDISEGLAECEGHPIEVQYLSALGVPFVIGLRPESLEIAPDGIAARVEVVEELGADAYAFCAADVGRGEQRLIARADYRNPPRTASSSSCARGPASPISSTPPAASA